MIRRVIPIAAVTLALAGCGGVTTVYNHAQPPAPKPVVVTVAHDCQWFHEHGEQEQERLHGCVPLQAGCTHKCPTAAQAEAEVTERRLRRQEHRISELQARQEAESESRRLEQREAYCQATMEVAGC